MKEKIKRLQHQLNIGAITMEEFRTKVLDITATSDMVERLEIIDQLLTLDQI